jgi:hypothetical protein
MKNLTIIFAVFAMMFASGSKLAASEEPVTNKTVFTSDDIKKLADAYVQNNLGLKNPAIVDIDLDGDFDILMFNDGKVEYYKNTGTLDKPHFVPENMNYDTYTSTTFIEIALPYPVFFADKNGDSNVDMFVVKDKMYNSENQQYEYSVLYAENSLNLSTGVLITIVLVLLIIVLVIFIVR